MENKLCAMSNQKKKFAIFACGPVGEMAVQLFDGAADQVSFILLDTRNFWEWNDRIISAAERIGVTDIVYYMEEADVKQRCIGLDAVILAFWSMIISSDLLGVTKWGWINLHTSFLPWGKGKHAHYWAIRENTPFGVSIMMIDEGLDTGRIIAQKEIVVDWTDTAKSLYFKALGCMETLLKTLQKDILSLNLNPRIQSGKGSLHYANEMESEIFLDRYYLGRDFLNFVRAKEFAPISHAYFCDGNKEYEVSIIIKERNPSRNGKINYFKLYNENIKN